MTKDIFGNVEWDGVDETYDFLKEYNSAFDFTSKEEFTSWLEFHTQILWQEKPREFLDWGTYGFMVYILPREYRLGNDKPLRGRVLLSSWTVNNLIARKRA